MKKLIVFPIVTFFLSLAFFNSGCKKEEILVKADLPDQGLDKKGAISAQQLEDYSEYYQVRSFLDAYEETRHLRGLNG